VKKKQTYEVGPPIEFEALGNGLNKSALQGRLLIARNAPGYNMFRQHIYDAISSNATSIMFDFTVERTAVKHFVDGVWLNLAPIPRILDKNTNKAPEELMLEAAKLLFGGNPEDRRSRQAGKFLAFVGRGKKKKTKYEADMTTQGTQTGEAAMVQFTASKIPFQNLDDIGMSPMMQPKFMEQINAKKGLFILSAPPANGLRSSMEVFSRVCDRFTRDVVNVEDTATQSEAVENIIQARYDSTRGETPMKVLPDVLFKEPRALIVRNMTNPEVMKLCLTEIDKTRMFTTMARAKDSVEAILQFLSLPQLQKSDFVRKLNAVICQRLIRKLCPDCKEPYQPAPQLLAQLGLNPQQVQQFYRKRTPLPNEAEERKRGVCPTCNGIGYHGRTAMFDLVIVSDSLREMLLSNPNPQLLRQQLAKERQNGFMLEGIRLLVEGETTLEEVSRVMKM
jgi:type II secretory ATPase GspE/PulE/Tfp pilus assembly ATPase PilB-like protein